MTEGPSIVQTIADQAGREAGARPQQFRVPWAVERLDVLTWELHNSLGPLFAPALNGRDGCLLSKLAGSDKREGRIDDPALSW